MGDRGILGWAEAVASEVVSFPDTLRAVRESVNELSKLGAKLDGMSEELKSTRGALKSSMDHLSGTIGTEMNHRLEHMDQVITQLTGTITDLLSAIPGARRAVRRTPTDGVPRTSTPED